MRLDNFLSMKYNAKYTLEITESPDRPVWGIN